jgi:hypothetical protein
MKLLSKYIHNFSDNTRVQIKIYLEFYNGIVYIANELLMDKFH